jgi:hypothetical protein
MKIACAEQHFGVLEVRYEVGTKANEIRQRLLSGE